jgi:hypothetical protein
MKNHAKKGKRFMRKLGNAMVAVLAAAAIIGSSTAAYAAPAPTAPAGATQQNTTERSGDASLRAAAAADGLLYVYSDDMGRDVTYPGNQSQWPTGWNDRVDQLWNNGFPGSRDDVNIYDYPWQNGAYACIGNGDFWDLRNDDYVFSWVNDGASDWQRDPLWETVHDAGTSHKWVDWCGNNNS